MKIEEITELDLNLHCFLCTFIGFVSGWFFSKIAW